MDIVERLTQFGLTRHEAAIYLTLLAEGDLNGYEVAKITGISRSNTYTSLASLVEKGGAYVIEDLNYNPEHESKIRRVRGCVETWQAGMKPAWLVDLRREMKTVDKIEWVDSLVAGKRSAVVLWKARDL